MRALGDGASSRGGPVAGLRHGIDHVLDDVSDRVFLRVFGRVFGRSQQPDPREVRWHG